ncbi:MAG: hypothetical protein IPG22_07335 [Acidobacteria bacterium]|nr:hypothetical protein [Acidobacteriota bacterium]
MSELIRSLNLQFGAIDLLVQPDGGIVFLEVNPNGQWLWLQEATGLPIADALVNLLTRQNS